MANIQFTHDTQGTNTYLVYPVQPGDTIDSMSLGMLTNNKIPGLAATQFMQMDTERYIRFNISVKVPISQFFAGAVNRKRLLTVFKGIVTALMSAEEYMIDLGNILMDLDYIYVDVSTFDTVMICLPVEEYRSEINLGQFFKNIMFNTQFDQTENCDYVAKIMNHLNSMPVFSMDDFAKLMDQLQETGQPVSAEASPSKSGSQSDASVSSSAEDFLTMPVSGAGSQSAVHATAQPAMQQPSVFATAPSSWASPQIQYQNVSQPAVSPVSAAAPSSWAPGTAQGQTYSQPANPAEAAPKKKSLFERMFHKEEEKKAKTAAAPAAPAQEKPKKEKKEKKEKPKKGGTPSFAVPGRQPSVPVGQPQSFAIPGQQPSVPVGQPRGGAAQQNASVPAQPQITQPQRPVVQPSVQQPANQYQSQPMDFGETGILITPSTDETTYLGPQQPQVEPKPRLIRERNNEIIPITKPMFRIGKERSYVDYFISDNPAISRSHANIITRGQEYFIMDTNSKNHSYVNGGMIQSSTEVRIDHGSKIRLADEDFEFKIY